MTERYTAIRQEDYGQSANTLFHFMKEFRFLESALRNRALVPRYCVEDVSYLGLHLEDEPLNNIAVLQKCFCDIPLHKLNQPFEVKPVHAHEEERSTTRTTTHPALYGEFAIAFSKGWGERNNLQPVHYLNPESDYTKDFAKLVETACGADDLLDQVADDVIGRLAFIKPLRGEMVRRTIQNSGISVSETIYKNFHDEQEWRYVPSQVSLESLALARILVNDYQLREKNIESNNRSLVTTKYQALWLTFLYDEIRYIIVPHAQARIDTIQLISSLLDEQFKEDADIQLQKYLLISKIIVLDEMRKDW